MRIKKKTEYVVQVDLTYAIDEYSLFKYIIYLFLNKNRNKIKFYSCQKFIQCAWGYARATCGVCTAYSI